MHFSYYKCEQDICISSSMNSLYILFNFLLDKVYVIVKIVLFLDMNVKTFSQFATSFYFTYAVLFACFVLCFISKQAFSFSN